MSNKEQKNSTDTPEASPIGYGNPPMMRRFKRSGNPRGRPNGAKNRETIVRTVANEVYRVTDSGKTVRCSTLELVLLRLRNIALEGKNLQAFDELHRLIGMREPSRTGPAPAYAIMPAELSMEEFIAVSDQDNALMDKYGVRTIAEAREMEREEMRKKKEQG
jgi:hypothetical protein